MNSPRNLTACTESTTISGIRTTVAVPVAQSARSPVSHLTFNPEDLAHRAARIALPEVRPLVTACRTFPLSFLSLVS
jgi:3-polyprenyl-4-hydroxybenzoate decarboxylase